VTAVKRVRPASVGAEVALASGAGLATFALVAVTVAAIDSDVLVTAFGLVCIVAVVAIVRFWGVAFAVPAAMTGLVAFDWFQFPPTHPLELPSSGDLANLLVYLTVAVVVGEAAAVAGRRAQVSEAARSELAEEQAALRRVATLVARGGSPESVFAAVAEEVCLLLRVETAKIQRFEADGAATFVAGWGEPEFAVAVGTRLALEGDNISSLVYRTGRPARVDDYAAATGPGAELAAGLGLRSAVGSPVVVEGRLWGAVIAGSRHVASLPAGIESRIGEFTELVAAAISNIEARSDLAASRARIVAASDDERRRVVRDLHDGAQQRLVHTIVTLKLASRALRREEERAPALVAEALTHAERANVELRELAHGIMPAVLTHGGLRAGVDALASRMPVPVENGVSVDRLPSTVEATAYFVVAEALTNVAKHARARHAVVNARLEAGTLRLDVRDDGVGGARHDGSGLMGLCDRLAVLDGRLWIESPVGGGTVVAAAVPLRNGNR
jgi:signal transduction histidine kinase